MTQKVSYATARKLRILKERLGVNWKDEHPDKSIDALYNEVMGDRRKNLFCKISPEAKERIDEMADGYDVKMAELVEQLIDSEYNRYKQRKVEFSNDLASQFATEV